MNNFKSYMRLLNLAPSLFWRLFISLLLMLLVMSTISIGIERWINAQALESRMALQVAHLVTVRQEVVQALESGDYKKVRQIYRSTRGLTNQLLIIDEQGLPFHYRFKPDWVKEFSENNREPKTANQQASPTERMIQHVIPDTSYYPELQDISVVTPDNYTYKVQLQPRLPLHELVALQRTHLPMRISIILLFSVLACYWFSRTLSKRIRLVQLKVHRMSEGDYLAGDDLSQLGDDELGILAKDVAGLSNRLADSEMSRKQMLSDISHELRSPLARLEVATELTRDYAPNATHYLDRIQKESTRMNELIGQIIHIQSLQMQRYVARPEDCESIDIAMLLDEIGQDVSFEFYDKHVEWQCLRNKDNSSDDELSYLIIGNREQLHSAFENVIRNAFIHSNSHSIVSSKIETIKLTHQTSTLKISIIDQGAGIDNDNLERIFQPFVRLDASRQRPTSPTAHSTANKTSKKEDGYGLGLAIAQAIIAAHKGQISARNREDGVTGLVVEIVLPVST